MGFLTTKSKSNTFRVHIPSFYTQTKKEPKRNILVKTSHKRLQTYENSIRMVFYKLFVYSDTISLIKCQQF